MSGEPPPHIGDDLDPEAGAPQVSHHAVLATTGGADGRGLLLDLLVRDALRGANSTHSGEAEDHSVGADGRGYGLRTVCQVDEGDHDRRPDRGQDRQRGIDLVTAYGQVDIINAGDRLRGINNAHPGREGDTARAQTHARGAQCRERATSGQEPHLVTTVGEPTSVDLPDDAGTDHRNLTQFVRHGCTPVGRRNAPSWETRGSAKECPTRQAGLRPVAPRAAVMSVVPNGMRMPFTAEEASAPGGPSRSQP